MTDREKLVELIFKSLCRHIHKSCKLAENIADDLIANGVTVRPMQKPLTLEELHDVKADAFLEIEGCAHIFHVSLPEFDGLERTKFRDAIASYGGEHGFICENRRYGELWRCWIERPTDEEMEAAKWE